MTDVPAAAPRTVRRSGFSRPNIPAQRIGASLAAMSALVSDALKMVYVNPYASHRRRPQAAPDEDLDGRDPDW
jgi:hypothetical protein